MFIMIKRVIKSILTIMVVLQSHLLFPASGVGPDGAFNYSIPLSLPPATGGIGPELSFSYNSEGGDGLLGLGWQLTGYDVISRDFRYPVRLIDIGSDEDHFVFMGQRLFKDPSTGYYRTESETYLRIEFCTGGPSGNGHYWKVTDKNGITRFYGSRSSSPSTLSEGGGYIFAHSSLPSDPARIWALDKVMDVHGNYYTISYVQDQAVIGSNNPVVTGWYPKRIIYTRNDEANKAFGKYRMVEFGYTQREDTFADSRPTPVSNKVLLSTIKVYTNVALDGWEGVISSTLHHRYDLSYESKDFARKSLLKSFQESSGDDTLEKPALQFTYTLNSNPDNPPVLTGTGTGASAIIVENNGSTTKPKVEILTNADFDGDGKDDMMIYKGNHTLKIYYSRPGASNGGFPGESAREFNQPGWKDTDYLAHGNIQSTMLMGDFNGDGKTDFMLYGGTESLVNVDQIWYMYLSVPGSATGEFGSPATIHFGDLAFLSLEYGKEYGEWGNVAVEYGLTPYLMRLGDFNGDGKTDILSLGKSNGSTGTLAAKAAWKIFLAKSDGSGFDAYPGYGTYSPAYVINGYLSSVSPWFLYNGDFTGDGRDDVIYCVTTLVNNVYTYGWYIAAPYSTGAFANYQDNIDFGKLYLRSRDQAFSPQLYFRDFNGDGKTDVLSHLTTRGDFSDPPMDDSWALFIADPVTGRFANLANNPPGATFTTKDVYGISPNLFGDFNGDGMTDFIVCHNVSGSSGNYTLSYATYLATGTTVKAGNFMSAFAWDGNENPDHGLGLSAMNIVTGDFDGNGWTDFMYKCAASVNPVTTNTTWKICTSGGEGYMWALGKIDLALNDANYYGGDTDVSHRKHSVVSPGNFTGDGKLSFIVNHSQHENNVDCDYLELYSPPVTAKANLLSSIYNGKGGTTKIDYMPATAFVAPDGTSTAVVPSQAVIGSRLPNTSPRSLVSEITIHSGILTRILGDPDHGTSRADIVGRTVYKYHNGLYFPGILPERRNLGFEYIEALDTHTHCKTKTWYYQQKPYSGSVWKVETYGYDGATTNGSVGILMTRTETQLASRRDDPNGLPFVYFVYKTSDKFTNYNEAGASITYETSYPLYDSFGNSTRIVNYGNPNTSSDDTETDIYFARNASSHLMKIWKMETWGRDGSNVWGLATRTIKYFDYSTQQGFVDKGRMTQIQSVAGSPDPDENAWLEYDNWGNCVKTTDARSIITQKTYDSNYHMLVTSVTTDPTNLNLTTAYGYDDLMNNTNVTDSNNIVVSRTYFNALNEPERVLGPYDTYENPKVRKIYDYTPRTLGPDGFLNDSSLVAIRTISKPVQPGYESDVLYEFFDGVGNLVRRTSKAPPSSGSAWRTIDYIYDRAGRMFKTSVPYDTGYGVPDSHMDNKGLAQKATITYYDFAGRPYKAESPDGSSIRTLYGLTWTGVIDKNGHYTQTDVAGNMQTAREYAGTYPSVIPYAETTTLSYRGGTKVTDANNNSTTTVVNMLGRTKQIASPDMGTWSFGYDLVGNNIQRTDAKNQTIYYSYDNANRIKTVRYPDNTTTVYTYDEQGHGFGKGKLTSVSYTNAGSVSYAYDKEGRITSETVTIDGVSKTESFTYYPTGLLANKFLPDGEILSFNYYLDGSLDTVDGTNPYVTEMKYSINGQLTSIGKGNGLTTYYDYYDNYWKMDATSQTYYSYRLRNESTSVYGGTIDYQYDKAGNLKVKYDNTKSGLSATYSYDEMNRLTGAVTDAFGTLSYAYDKVGNITSKAGFTYTYTPGTNRLAFDGMNYYQYDANGNMTGKSTTTSTVAPQARIGSTNYATLQAAYAAATWGTTIKATAGAFSGDIAPGVTSASNVTFSGGWDSSFANVTGLSTLGGQIANNYKTLNFENFVLAASGGYSGYRYDYNNMLIAAGSATYAYFGERRVKKVENGTTTRYFFDDYEEETTGASTNIVKYYVGGAIRSTADGLVFVYKDVSGNSSLVTDADGILVKRLIYDPFGSSVVDTSDSRKLKRKFGGGETDATGLSYFGARYYDPAIGRFITADTIVPAGGPQCLNRYAYCGNNPVNYIDPSGHSWFTDGLSAIGSLLSIGPSLYDLWNTLMDGTDYVTKPVLKFVLTPMERLGIKEIHFGIWFGIGGEISINCETGDYSGNGGFGGGMQGGVSTKYADIGGDCSTHVGLGYNSADKSLYFKASASAEMGGYGYGGTVTIGYSFKNHVGYQSTSLCIGPYSMGYSVYGSDFDYYGGMNFYGLSCSWSNHGGFSLGFSLSDGSGNSAGVSYNVNNGEWRGSVGIDMCFVAGTRVETANGEKNIEDIEVGDMVRSYDETTGEFGYKRVVATIVTHPDAIVKVRIADETLECTEVHPFYVLYGADPDSAKARWIEAGDLVSGMTLLGSDGSIRTVSGIEIVERDETTYNFEVEDWHTYCVGKYNVVVHNDCVKNGYGSADGNKVFNAIVDAVGQYCAGPEPADAHDCNYADPDKSRAEADLQIHSDMVMNATGNAGCTFVPEIFYLALRIGGGKAYRKAQADAIHARYQAAAAAAAPNACYDQTLEPIGRKENGDYIFK